jgi:DNA anti-recombination protein RmuC
MTVEAMAAMIIQTVIMTAGFYKWMTAREDKMIQKMEVMHKDQDERIREAEKEASAIRNNYNAKFQRAYDAINQTKLDVVEAIHTMENNLRESHHNLAENVSKAIAELQMMMRGAK